MAEDMKENTILVFHSYPKKPCIDGLMSAILASVQYEDSNIALLPYWRTKDCFERLKTIVGEVGLRSTRIVYVDCAPEIEGESEYLSGILETVPVTVYDHHPISEKSPMKQLMGNRNFTLQFDTDICAAKMIYKLLSEERKKSLECEDLLDVIQYSEYEGMNPKLAGKEHAENICKDAFSCAISALGENTTATNTLKNLNTILQMDMTLYFVLDQIMTKDQDWTFFYDTWAGYQEIYRDFKVQTQEFLTNCKSILNGESESTYGAVNTRSYLATMAKLPQIFATGKMIKKQQIGDKFSNVFAVELSIFEFGRTLEPFVRKQLEKVDAQYAVLMNPPSTRDGGVKSYYYSLRRLNENFDARDLVAFIKEKTGTTIGGGHPWACGVNLDEEQREKFLKLLS